MILSSDSGCERSLTRAYEGRLNKEVKLKTYRDCVHQVPLQSLIVFHYSDHSPMLWSHKIICGLLELPVSLWDNVKEDEIKRQCWSFYDELCIVHGCLVCLFLLAIYICLATKSIKSVCLEIQVSLYTWVMSSCRSST